MDRLHAALATEVVGRESAEGVEFAIVRLRDSKTSERWTLHARPHTYSTAGWQTTDVLGSLGFRHGACSFVVGEQCYAREVEPDFDLPSFAKAFTLANRNLLDAVRHLEACGLGLAQPEGWAFFTGRAHGRSRPVIPGTSGDGHTTPERTQLKRAEDEAFFFALTYIKGSRDRGWVMHYRPKHPPLTVEIGSALAFIGLREFQGCPEFDFEPCRWRFIPKANGDDPFDRMTMWAHQWFDAHPANFSPAIEKLLATQSAVNPFGMSIFPIERAPGVTRTAHGSAKQAGGTIRTPDAGFTYDVAISFAGADRAFAERVAILVREAGFKVFYDDFYPEKLWGKDLAVFFDEVFRKQSRYCLVLISKQYLERPWTEHERRSAVARMLKERGGEYLLPVQLESVELPGVAPTIGYLSAERYSPTQIAELLIEKLKKPT